MGPHAGVKRALLARGGSVLSFFREKESTKENAPSSAGRLALTRRAAWLCISCNDLMFQDYG